MIETGWAVVRTASEQGLSLTETVEQICQNQPVFMKMFAEHTDDARSIATLMLLWAEWAQQAFPRISLGHRHAAAMCCTEYGGIDLPTPPWPVFAIGVPPSIIDEDPRCFVFVRQRANGNFDILREDAPIQTRTYISEGVQ